tara:strand:- start:531 stop:683 length:153 start_codon:yes stop_codon:yes gene_type:complete
MFLAVFSDEEALRTLLPARFEWPTAHFQVLLSLPSLLSSLTRKHARSYFV